MTLKDIPRAEDCVQSTIPSSVSLNDSYEKQKIDCLEAIHSINKDKPSVAVNLTSVPDGKLVSELEEKGFLVKYKLTYDAEKTPKLNCRLRIINPKLLTSSVQIDELMDNISENMKSFGFGQVKEGEDAIEKLFSQFMTK